MTRFFIQAEGGIRYLYVTGVQTCALPIWQYPAWGLAREGVGHVRVWATATASAGYLAVVTDTGGIISVTESAGRIRAGLARSEERRVGKEGRSRRSTVAYHKTSLC